ncbi:hypothetical protein NSA50_17055 [Clostridium sp. DSM 100503]|uniref:hypothetical protein n=1 Tax=Clostridium sp. DSM 100503 TaxID=2963282 RepID=UPI00214A197F|nr:hypothetical protein [Clostridium sp. DSM 100503]MCR1952734.1 hypothetical protein [Clostridium sp. DSM 100503]
MSELIIYMIENEVNKYEFNTRNKKIIENRVENKSISLIDKINLQIIKYYCNDE